MSRLLLTLTVCAASLASCSASDDSSVSGPSYGELRTEAGADVVVNDHFSSWLIIGINDQREILLSTKRPPYAEPTAPWAVVMRIPSSTLIGAYDVSSVDMHLFSSYASQCCGNVGDPFGDYESYDSAFVAVAGTVTFSSLMEGEFDVELQQESPARTGNVFGPKFEVKGCWNIGAEGQQPGCKGEVK